jgi:hypothetical protein
MSVREVFHTQLIIRSWQWGYDGLYKPFFLHFAFTNIPPALHSLRTIHFSSIDNMSAPHLSVNSSLDAQTLKCNTCVNREEDDSCWVLKSGGVSVTQDGVTFALCHFHRAPNYPAPKSMESQRTQIVRETPIAGATETWVWEDTSQV